MNFVLLADYAGINLPINIIQNDKKYDDDITVFPNPAKDFIRVHNYNDILTHKIDIFDLTGRLVQSVQTIEQQQNIIRLDHLGSGTYFMRIYTNKGVVNKKIIKQ
jgi:hypothetical protein